MLKVRAAEIKIYRYLLNHYSRLCQVHPRLVSSLNFIHASTQSLYKYTYLGMPQLTRTDFARKATYAVEPKREHIDD
jgi:hypothetical protein